MASVQPLPLSLGRGALAAVALAACLATGCVSTAGSLWPAALSPAKKVPCQIVCTWQNNVAFVADPTRGGNPGPGLVGRLYLFGPEVDHPMEAEGTLTVDLYDDTGAAPRMVERWIIDPQTLARLSKRDMIGCGYTVFLPWSQYRPDISKVRLRSNFQSAAAKAPLYTENVVTLAAGNGVIREGTGPITPTAGFKKGR